MHCVMHIINNCSPITVKGPKITGDFFPHNVGLVSMISFNLSDSVIQFLT